jgi:hypothetical protein
VTTGAVSGETPKNNLFCSSEGFSSCGNPSTIAPEQKRTDFLEKLSGFDPKSVHV